MNYFLANFKANPKTKSQLEKLIDFYLRYKNKKWKIAIFPPNIFIGKVFWLTKGKIGVGAQNIYYQEGAYTGEISAAMAKSVGAKYSLVGHSERRKYFGETDESIALKMRSVLNNKLIPVLCIGEKKSERRVRNRILNNQLGKALKFVKKSDKFFVAYEPVWAIGTGLADTLEKSNTARLFIKKLLIKKLGKAGSKIPVLYGGSINSKNYKGFINIGFDGLLVGGASLKPKEVKGIVSSG